MAVCVCHADGALNEPEQQFLTDLRQALGLADSSMNTHHETARAIAETPLTGAPPPIIDTGREAELDQMILNAAILNGALELMPHTLATIGKRYGYELDRGHIKDFLGTVGIGLTSQVFEGFTRKLIGGLTRGLAGGLLGGLVGQAAGSAVGFVSTYALGHVAKRYYASGRSLSAEQLRQVFGSLLDEARSMQGRYAGDIARKSSQVNVSELLPLVRQQ